jgi:hypothetical protein
MDRGQQQHHSHLFTLRLWKEDLGNDQAEWRGKVQHVVSAESHYFRDWPTLIAQLLKLLPQAESQLETGRAIELSELDDVGGIDSN